MKRMKIEGLSNLPAKDQNRLGEIADKLEEIDEVLKELSSKSYEAYKNTLKYRNSLLETTENDAAFLEAFRKEVEIRNEIERLVKRRTSLGVQKNTLLLKYVQNGAIKLNRPERKTMEGIAEGEVVLEGITGWSRVSNKKEAWTNAHTGTHYVRRKRGGFVLSFRKGSWPVELGFWENEDGTIGVNTDGTSLKTNRACLEALIKLLEKEYEIE